MERVTRIELALSAWEADVLPLNYPRERRRAYPNPGFRGIGECAGVCAAARNPRRALRVFLAGLVDGPRNPAGITRRGRSGLTAPVLVWRSGRGRLDGVYANASEGDHHDCDDHSQRETDVRTPDAEFGTA